MFGIGKGAIIWGVSRNFPPPEIPQTEFHFRAAKGPPDLSLFALQPLKGEAEARRGCSGVARGG